MRKMLMCPLCDWEQVRTMWSVETASEASIGRISTALGIAPGVFLAQQSHQAMADDEEELEKHLASHSTVEWLRALMDARRERDTLREQMEARG